jgi:putative ABC transport system ATP-binding protein
MIKLHKVKKAFSRQQDKLPILDVAGWTVNEGERVALLGPSGSGKSTLLHLLSGILAPDTGEAEVCGQCLHRMGEAERDRFRADNIGYVMQDFHLIGSLTASENIELVWTGKGGCPARRRLLESWFDRVGLGDRMHHRPGQLSRGQQQRVAIIRAMACNPRLVLADEPTGSLDWETAGGMMRLLLELCREEGTTLVTVTHDLHLAELFPDKVQMRDINTAFQAPLPGGKHACMGGIGA